MQAVKRFGSDKRFRLTTCAMCKAAICPALVVARKDGHTRAPILRQP
jgi:hypothetical protein